MMVRVCILQDWGTAMHGTYRILTRRARAWRCSTYKRDSMMQEQIFAMQKQVKCFGKKPPSKQAQMGKGREEGLHWILIRVIPDMNVGSQVRASRVCSIARAIKLLRILLRVTWEFCGTVTC